MGYLPGYGRCGSTLKVWQTFYTCKAQGKYRITFDSDNGNKVVVYKKDGSKKFFKQSKRGLYYFKASGDTIEKKFKKVRTVERINDGCSKGS